MKALVLALAAAAIVSTQTGGGATGFTAHEIGTGLRGGYQVVVADLNKDGKPDIIALASGLPELLWYENPGWQKHVLASGVSQLINAAAYDIDGDGIPEIAVAQGFTMSPKTSKGQIGLLTHGADVTAPWTYKEIDAVPTAHRIRWIDADGSGKKLLAMAPLIGPDSTPPDYKAPMSILFYRAPDWKREAVTDALTGLVHGIETTPWDGVKGEVLLSAGFTGVNQYRFANGTWTQTELSKGDPQPWPKSGASDVKLARLGAQKFLATIEPWHGNEVVIYTASWRRLGAPGDRRPDRRWPYDHHARHRWRRPRRSHRRSARRRKDADALHRFRRRRELDEARARRRRIDGGRRLRRRRSQRRQAGGRRLHRHRDGEPEVVRERREDE